MSLSMRHLRLPYRVRAPLSGLRNRALFYGNKLIHRTVSVGSEDRISVTVHCGFQGQSGGSYAMANLANLLATRCYVRFVSFPRSMYNSLLSTDVAIVDNIDERPLIAICDVSTPLDLMGRLKERGSKVIVSCHGLPNELHQLAPTAVSASLDVADRVHFVGDAQAYAFGLPPARCRVIANVTRAVRKTKRTTAVGLVGNLSEPRKNLTKGLAVSLRSMASEIHLWGGEVDSSDRRVVGHGWESDKGRIYNSFDVLVFLSRMECCPMVVIEALSAGIPCVLSDIAAHQQFRDCAAVKLVDPDDEDAGLSALDQLLRDKDALRSAAVEFWSQQFSPAAICDKWSDWLSSLLMETPITSVGSR